MFIVPRLSQGEVMRARFCFRTGATYCGVVPLRLYVALLMVAFLSCHALLSACGRGELPASESGETSGRSRCTLRSNDHVPIEYPPANNTERRDMPASDTSKKGAGGSATSSPVPAVLNLSPQDILALSFGGTLGRPDAYTVVFGKDTTVWIRCAKGNRWGDVSKPVLAELSTDYRLYFAQYKRGGTLKNPLTVVSGSETPQLCVLQAGRMQTYLICPLAEGLAVRFEAFAAEVDRVYRQSVEYR